MKAGRELDALVAEKVMEWEWRGLSHGWYHGEGRLFLDEDELPHYSTQIADAWLVVEKLVGDGFYVDIGVQEDRAQVQLETLTDRSWTIRVGSTEAPTAPLAICLAALKVVE